MNDAVREAIEGARVAELRELMRDNPLLVDGDVSWGEGGKNVVPPLHFVCDVVFRRLVSQEQSLALADVLLEAGADLGRVAPKSGDTFLIAAASLGAEAVGLRLVERGVDIHARGLFGASALHWAAIMGLGELAKALIGAGADLELVDREYDCTPLQWALHGWVQGTNGRREGIPDVVRGLVAQGAQVPGDAADPLVKDSDQALREALSSG